MKCPYCNKPYHVPEVAFLNVEYYGSNNLNIKCKLCKKIVRVSLRRIVKLDSLDKTDSKELSFG